jgi:DegV family protein with EDD domain
MMNLNEVRIATDSSADLWELDGVSVGQAPLKIRTDVKEYVDDAALDVDAMNAELAQYKGKSGTSCPSMGDFLEAFGDAKYVFCITMTSKLSATHGVALSAARAYEEENPGRRAYVVDSLSTGPGMKLLAEYIVSLVREGLEFDEICERVNAYRKETELLFLLESLNNLANNGRVSRAVALIAGILGVRLLGHALEGVINPVAKPRGEKKALEATFAKMQELGYCGGKLRISYNANEKAAKAVSDMVRAKYPEADVEIYPARALCRFYAERGGIILGFEVKK